MSPMRTKIVSLHNCKTLRSQCRRHWSQERPNFQGCLHQTAWRLGSYQKGVEGLTLQEMRSPPLKCPNDVLIKVKASSVNPLDLMMTQGYGSKFFNVVRTIKELTSNPEDIPLTLGRDFCGEIVDKGQNVKSLEVGQEVWGVVLPTEDGSHASHVIASQNLVTKKPESLNAIESASIPYAGMTALSSLKLFGDVRCQNQWEHKRVLILGASGGVGHLGLQILKSWGSQVLCTSKSDAIPMLEEFGADEVLDYQSAKHRENLMKLQKFDLILDCASQNDLLFYQKLLKSWSGAKYLTLTSPFLKNFDSYGTIYGLSQSVGEIVSKNVQSLMLNGSTNRWAFFVPFPEFLSHLKSLVEEKKLKPKICQVIPYSSLPQALKLLEIGSIRGKIVVDHSK